jgi:chemotaxis protein CheC
MIKLTDEQIDALKEMVNIGVGKAANLMNIMLQSHVQLHVPILEVMSPTEIFKKQGDLESQVLSAVRIGFSGPFAGNASLVFPESSAAKLVALLTEDEFSHEDFDELRVGAITEVGNIVLNSVLGAISNELQLRIHYNVPVYVEESVDNLVSQSVADQSTTIIWVQTTFSVEKHEIVGNIILIFEVGSLDQLLDAIDKEIERIS